MSTVSAERLATIFVEAADTLVDEFDLLDFMHMLVDRARSLVDAAAAGLMLADEYGRLEFMAGSDDNVRLVGLFQIQNDQGPCLEAFRTGRSVINVDLASATQRWPRFAPRAEEAGFHSVHAFPLRLRTQVIGALNIFGDSAGGDFDPTDVPVMQALADVATIGLMQERALRRSEALTEQLQGALNSRIIIEQAKGALAQVLGVSVDEAFRRIRTYARNNNRRLTEVSELIVTDLNALPGLAQR
ncbi:GAF and ANTAR domain-containing protein [Actinoplanes xinjiangensis]|jgi:GAF domain-containing protein|uniref:GAF domain-containing protein n=1 Tax=Actinoplanes xinjiangensis TaxID=512350 RepID=A0A316F4X6_9ACTN|nr:GAF and ANTAR domain-containing protein [Actinoplanes xinjiangensis]PWK40874.1 GAF domain-containing protein [Actinoplanes xinjiangensis]GIF43388.1 transcriptional regulator [Actinoplanes xinjiangensis]